MPKSPSNVNKFAVPGKWRRLWLVVAFAAALAAPASAQDWIPQKCCPETDCRGELLKVTEVRGGFTVETVAEVIAYDDPRIQPSQDGRYHACVRTAARPWMSETMAGIAGQRVEVKCLFIPLTG